MTLPVPTRMRRTSSKRPGTRAGGPRLHGWMCFEPASQGAIRERDFNIFWEDGANFDMSAKGADVITQRSEFDFEAISRRENSLCSIFIARASFPWVILRSLRSSSSVMRLRMALARFFRGRDWPWS